LEHPAGLPVQLCALLNLRAGQLQLRLGRPGKARERFQRALDLFDLSAEGCRRRTEVMRYLVQLDLNDVHPSIAALIAGTAGEARSAGMTGEVLPFLGHATALLGRVDEGLALVAEAGDPAHPEHAALVMVRAGRVDEALELAARSSGAQGLLAKGWALMIRGDFDGAREALDTGEDLVRRSESYVALPAFHEAHAHVARLSSRPDEAWDRSRRSLRRAVEQGDTLTAMRAAYLFLALARDGHPQAVEIARLVRECRLRTGLPAWPFADQEMADWEADCGATEIPPAGWYPDVVLTLLGELAAKADGQILQPSQG
jgi:tetratricopeptide (TPR) repeat protein